MAGRKKKNSKEFRDKFQKRFFTRSSTIALIFGVLVLIIFVIGTLHLKNRERQLDETIAELNTEIRDINRETGELKEEKKNMDTDSFKEKIAREILGMIGKDEYTLKESEESGEKKTTAQEKTTAGSETSETKKEP